MEPFKHRENFVGVLLIEADSVVHDDDLRPLVIDVSRDPNPRRDAGLVKFDGVGEEVLQELPHLQRIGLDRRQLAGDDLRRGVVNAQLEIVDDFGGDARQID